MGGLDGLLLEAQQLHEYILGEARNSSKKDLARHVAQYNSLVDAVRKMPSSAYGSEIPFPKFEDLDAWPVALKKPRKEAVGFIWNILRNISEKVLDAIDETYLAPQYAKDCYYCGNSNYIVRVVEYQRQKQAKEAAVQVCIEQPCLEKYFRYKHLLEKKDRMKTSI